MLKRVKRSELNVGDNVKVLYPTEEGEKRYISGWVLWLPDTWLSRKIPVAIGRKDGKILSIKVGVSKIYLEK